MRGIAALNSRKNDRDVGIQIQDREPMLRASGLTRIYTIGEIEVRALDGIELEVKRGEFLVILGPSGSGKSTLLNILGGLDLPSAGGVWFLDRNLSEEDDRHLTRFRRNHVGFVFQFYNLIPSLTATENVALVSELAANPLPPAEALALVDLESRADHFPSQLSGGEQQRVAIARAITKRPDILLCDEPTGALDLETGKVVLRALADANQDLGTTTIVITHNAGIAAMADRVIRMGSGRIVAEMRNEHRASPDELTW